MVSLILVLVELSFCQVVDLPDAYDYYYGVRWTGDLLGDYGEKVIDVPEQDLYDVFALDGQYDFDWWCDVISNLNDASYYEGALRKLLPTEEYLALRYKIHEAAGPDDLDVESRNLKELWEAAYNEFFAEK